MGILMSYKNQFTLYVHIMSTYLYFKYVYVLSVNHSSTILGKLKENAHQTPIQVHILTLCEL